MVRARLQAEVFAGEVEVLDLAAAVAGETAGAHDAFQHLVDVVGALALAEYLFLAAEGQARADGGQQGLVRRRGRREGGGDGKALGGVGGLHVRLSNSVTQTAASRLRRKFGSNP